MRGSWAILPVDFGFDSRAIRGAAHASRPFEEGDGMKRDFDMLFDFRPL